MSRPEGIVFQKANLRAKGRVVKGKYHIILAVLFLQLVNYVDRVIMGFAAPSMMSSLSIDASSFGIAMSAFAVGYLFTQLPGGLLADRWGARIVLIIGPIFWAIFTGMMGLVSTVGALIAIRLFFGISEGLSQVAVYKVLGDNFEPAPRAKALSMWATALVLAPMLTGPAVGFLLSSFSWRHVFMLLAIPAVVAAAVNYFCLPSSPEKPGATSSNDSDSRGGNFAALAKQPLVWLIGACLGFWNVAHWGMLGWMPTYLAMERHIDIKGSGLLSGIPYVFGLVGLSVSGWLGSSIFLRYRPQLLAAFCIGGSISFYVAYVSTTLTLSLAGLSAVAFCIYAGLATYGAVVLDLAPAHARATFTGITSTVGQIGSVLAPTVIGYLVSKTGTFAAVFAFMAGSLLVSALLAILVLLVSKKGVYDLGLTPSIKENSGESRV